MSNNLENTCKFSNDETRPGIWEHTDRAATSHTTAGRIRQDGIRKEMLLPHGRWQENFDQANSSIAGLQKSSDFSEKIEDLIISISGQAFPSPNSTEMDLVRMQKNLQRAKSATAELDKTLSAAEMSIASRLVIRRPNQNWFDRMYSQLARLEDGWAGENSEAPSTSQLSDFSKLRSVLDTFVETPTVQVEDDGLIGLLWEQSTKTFCLSLLGDGKAMGTLSPYRLRYESWILEVGDEQQLLNRLSDEQLSELFAANAV